MTRDADTIAAVATAPGEGGIAVVRISGPDSHAILRACFRRGPGGGLPPEADVALEANVVPEADVPPGRLCYGRVTDARGASIDEAMAVRMSAPNTYTRQDVAEIHCHGGCVQARRVLCRVLALGARAAGPGEFTYRAFMNGRLDLSEAEAVMALVASSSDASARAAMRQLEGGVSRTIRSLAERITDLIALIEAGDDFPEEIEEKAASDEVLSSAREIRAALESASDARNARVLREGLAVVLAGRPNTGKSSLLNALLNSDRAIVTEHAGTTRDLVSEDALIEGCRVTLVDTAGQREASDPIERLGVERARRAEQSADLVLMVLDGSAPLTPDDEALIKRADARWMAVVNKCDLEQRLDKSRLEGIRTLCASAKTGAGIEDIRREIASRAAVPGATEGRLMLERHLDCARAAAAALGRAERTVESGAPLDLAAIDLTCALEALLTITGERASDQVIANVFANFCVGK